MAFMRCSLAFAGYCRYQYCMACIAIKDCRRGTLDCAIVWAMKGGGGPKQGGCLRIIVSILTQRVIRGNSKFSGQRLRDAARAPRRLRSGPAPEQAWISIHKTWFCFRAFVHESMLLFANSSLFGHPPHHPSSPTLLRNILYPPDPLLLNPRG